MHSGEDISLRYTMLCLCPCVYGGDNTSVLQVYQNPCKKVKYKLIKLNVLIISIIFSTNNLIQLCVGLLVISNEITLTHLILLLLAVALT